MNKILEKSLKELKKKKFLNPELDLKILLEHSSYIKENIFLSNVNLDKINLKYFKKLISKRLNSEPISKIINTKYFWKYKFYVNSYVLDPRPESELIIEQVLNNVKNKSSPLKILDIGTGSGCLSICLAKELKNSKIVAIDISKQALKVAKTNAINNNVEQRIIFKHQDIKNLTGKFDIIVSNPPYISQNDYNELSNEIKLYEPKIALLGGEDGLKYYRILSNNLDKIMKKNSMFVCEIGYNQLIKSKKIFSKSKLMLKKVSKDIQNIDRTLTFFKI